MSYIHCRTHVLSAPMNTPGAREGTVLEVRFLVPWDLRWMGMHTPSGCPISAAAPRGSARLGQPSGEPRCCGLRLASWRQDGVRGRACLATHATPYACDFKIGTIPIYGSL